ncbi:ABC transporter ATP-binding protein [Natrinema gelatinilyticum]|uniref:ABC transporter ATP-binding protein n=1 Tax=Natrinema gelatinilyticum TaxID=2961571 RepID=UPI0020C1CE13|nr:ABC transporter ATP-binding protein [Natrinema gelatinilyticum]
MTLLEVSDLRTGYGDLQILDGIDLSVEDGEYVTIIGPNGAGKSTLMDSIFGLTDHKGGTVTYAGEDITALETEERIRQGMNYVPQDDSIFEKLSVIENLKMGAYTEGELSDAKLQDVYSRFPVLEERTAQISETMSGGQRQMLAIGRALISEPDLLLLDEPSSGLAPHLVDDLFDKIDEINADGTAVLIVEQNAEEILHRADRGYLLTDGQIQREDSADGMLADEEIRQKFLAG